MCHRKNNEDNDYIKISDYRINGSRHHKMINKFGKVKFCRDTSQLYGNMNSKNEFSRFSPNK